jgi:SAM-dependent methyltransferase
MMLRTAITDDAFGSQLLAYYLEGVRATEIIERDDRHIASGVNIESYFAGISGWTATEQEAIRFAKGRVLDVGCGAGRHSLYLQSVGLHATAIDNSPGAVRVCKLRGLQDVRLKSVTKISELTQQTFDTILMLGSNFGLCGSGTNAKVLLRRLHSLTTHDGILITESVDPHQTSRPAHLDYYRRNVLAGRLPGQVRLRVRFENIVGPWFPYLFVSPAEMRTVLHGTGWKIIQLIQKRESTYIAIIAKAG